jgi:hypothetical protein
MRLRDVVNANPGRKLDNPQPPKPRAPRPNQLAPQNAPGHNNKRKAADSGGEGDAGGSRSSFKDWELRKQDQNDAWERRRAADVAMLIASTPAQAALQATRRAAEVAAVQALLQSTPPWHRCRTTAADGDSGSGSGSSGASRLSQTDTAPATYHGLGGVVGTVVQPVYRCCGCGLAGITVHPMQICCVPTAPTINSTLLSIELVEQFRLQQLKAGIGGHGECNWVCLAPPQPPLPSRHLMGLCTARLLAHCLPASAVDHHLLDHMSHCARLRVLGTKTLCTHLAAPTCSIRCRASAAGDASGPRLRRCGGLCHPAPPGR